ncbi:putative protein [Geobacter sp. OR-1]|uniref:transglutaminase-like domain-containing protein n=1 Tax=Geobacter sp. OR-1 TaxID=1266765 RepID=UPI000541968F|nr:transglutaminase family protein [Geobacter sp. OR-1]GAM09473.1 putative protein [Geobacter sp. OR-1]
MKRFCSIILLGLLLVPFPAHARTLLLEGKLDTEVAVRQRVSFGVDKPLSEIVYRYPLPATVNVHGFSQNALNSGFIFDPRPTAVNDETDKYGNRFKVLTWNNITSTITGEVSFTTVIAAELRPVTVTAPFPLKGVSAEHRVYLQPSKLVQSDHPGIRARSAALTAGATSQPQAVAAILNFVADHIVYETPPSSYDALFALQSGTGNCQNFAHLAIALLRASGIPARAAVGLTLKDKWRIPTDDLGSVIVQGMGEGMHAWLEIWYPELGWLPYDPQQSRQFTSTRHIKFSHGPECANIGVSWRGAPELPVFSTVISSSFGRDVIDLRLKGTGNEPRGYMASNRMTGAEPEPLPPPPVVEPARPKPPPPSPVPPPKPQPKPQMVKPAPKADDSGLVVFGNPRLPEKLSLQTITGNSGELALERETAEYVTSTAVYAQAFIVDRLMTLQTVSIGMKKFGGDGTVYLDIAADDNGRPALMNGVRTRPIPLEQVRKLPGYGWLDFPVPTEAGPFKPGKYWIVFRRSGEAIMNWYYTPGKPYSGPDDTRSTARGWQWEDILPYDFVFKVTAKQL